MYRIIATVRCISGMSVSCDAGLCCSRHASVFRPWCKNIGSIADYSLSTYTIKYQHPLRRTSFGMLGKRATSVYIPFYTTKHYQVHVFTRFQTRAIILYPSLSTRNALSLIVWRETPLSCTTAPLVNGKNTQKTWKALFPYFTPAYP